LSGMIKNITIANFHHDDNKGDSAIILSSIENLKRQGHNLKFTVIGQFYYQKGREFRHLKHSFGNKVKYHRSLVPRLDEFWNWMPVYTIRVFAWSCSIVLSLLKDTTIYLYTKKGREPIKNTDLLLLSGGQLMYKWNNFYWPMLIFHLYPLIIGLLYKVPSVIHCISVPNFPPKSLVGITIKFLFNHCKIVAVRTNWSKNILLQLGINKSLIRVVPDPAFLLPNTARSRLGRLGKKYKLKKGGYITITIREGRKPSKKYTSEINTFIKELIKKYKVVLLATSIGPETGEDDRLLINHISDNLRSDNLITITEDLHPIECLKIISNSKLLIGTRFHSLIFGLGSKIPVLAISYSPKTLNTFNMLGYSNLVVHVNKIEGKRILTMARKTINKQKSTKKLVAKKLKVITNKINNYNLALVKLLKQ
jgi:colanic acid/amylovoran biosynthesis protein